MRGFMAGVVALAVSATTSCGGGSTPEWGLGSAFKPAQCLSTQFTGDLTGARAGQYVTYITDNMGHQMSQTIKVLGREGADWLVEHWLYIDATAYGYLFQIGADKKIRKAWAAAKIDAEWTSIPVKEPEAVAPEDHPTSRIKRSSEKKEVKAGVFDCTRIDMTVSVKGKEFPTTAWYSKDVPCLYKSGEHGGVVMEAAGGGRTWLEAKGDDALPAFVRPAK